MTLVPELLLPWPAGLVRKEGRSYIGFGAKEARWQQRGLHHLVPGGVSVTSSGSASTPLSPIWEEHGSGRGRSPVQQAPIMSEGSRRGG